MRCPICNDETAELREKLERLEAIELRFLERTEKTMCDGDYEVGKRVRVLQWRKRLRKPGTDLGPGWVWTDWEDVPLVIEA